MSKFCNTRETHYRKKFDYKLNKVFLIIKKILNKYKKASYVKQSKHSHETFHNNITIKDF